MTFALFFMILAHLIYDFHCQGEFIAKYKAQNDFVLFIHSLTYAMILSVVLLFSHIFAFWAFLLLLVSHFFIDRWKARKKDICWNDVYIDQALHLAIILIVLIIL